MATLGRCCFSFFLELVYNTVLIKPGAETMTWKLQRGWVSWGLEQVWEESGVSSGCCGCKTLGASLLGAWGQTLLDQPPWKHMGSRAAGVQERLLFRSSGRDRLRRSWGWDGDLWGDLDWRLLLQRKRQVSGTAQSRVELCWNSYFSDLNLDDSLMLLSKSLYNNLIGHSRCDLIYAVVLYP